MSKAYPWVVPPWPDNEYPRDKLEERIHETLILVNTCVLATINKAGKAIASPIEYYPDRLDLYMLPDEGSPKLLSMERDPEMSLAVHMNHNTWAHARGLQYFARAEVIKPHAPGWDHGMEIFRWRAWAEEMEWTLEKPPELTLVKVVPHKILYTDTWLWKEGYSAKQTWHREP